jgi:hypothetical protein
MEVWAMHGQWYSHHTKKNHVGNAASCARPPWPLKLFKVPERVQLSMPLSPPSPVDLVDLLFSSIFFLSVSC